MRNNTVRHYRMALRIVGGLALALWCWGCASIGHPSGGPRDEDPPRFVKANPAPGSTDVSRDRITIEFNELINLKDAFTNVVTSPSSARAPRVSAQGRRIVVQFQDSMQPNTTYTIDFGNSIEDNNEGNKLQGFAYTFSTGPEIDSLQIAGMVLAASNLEPQQGIIVGVHSNLADSAFRTLRFDRVARTDDRGRFVIRGLRDGEYRLFALKDLNNDYRWDNPEEDIAFFPGIIRPGSERVETSDTIYNLKTGAVDSVVSRMRTRFLPNDVLLTTFNIDRAQRYMQNQARVDSTRLSFIFGGKPDELPSIRLLDYPDEKDWYVLERTEHSDTLTYWLRSDRLVHADTLRVEATYMRHDKDFNLLSRTDTLRFITERPRLSKKAKKQKTDSVPVQKFIDLSLSGTSDVFGNVRIEFGTPLARLDSATIRLYEKVDTVWTPVSGTPRLLPDSLVPRRMKLAYPWNYGTQYKLSIDSLAATDIYGLHSKFASTEFKIKNQNDYGNVSFQLSGLPDSIPAFVELLNGSDSPVRRLAVHNGAVDFRNVDAGTYYARLIIDTNGNGKHDHGDYDVLLQPEDVYYYPKKVTARRGWDLEFGWNITATAVDLQKPEAIKKNRPAADKDAHNRRESSDDEEDEFFDPTANPFDPNRKVRNSGNSGLFQ